MQKRVIAGLVVVFLMLAVQDKFFRKDAGSFVGTTKLPAETTHLETKRPSNTELFVTRVIDGDTVVVLIHDVSEKVRLIGVDTPETVDPRKPIQCFGKEASAFTKTLLENKAVRLVADNSQGDRDKYGRLLRYIFLEDGTFVNEKIIAMGYGHEYTYRLPYQYQIEFKNAENSARELQKGLWANSACGVTNIL